MPDIPLSGILPALSLLLAAACGSDPAPLFGGEGLNLLARRADRVLCEPGHLTPGEGAPWGPYAMDGWRAGMEGDAGGPALAWCRQPVARLVLPLLEPSDRELELQLRMPAGEDQPAGLVVRLNDHPLGEFALGAELETLRLEAPAAVWLRGDNVLELEVDQMRPVGGDAGEPTGVGLASVSYGAEGRRVEADAREARARLEPDTGLVYALELLTPSAVVLRGKSAGAGRLEVRFAEMDPRTGLTGAATDPPLRVPTRDGVIDDRLILPRPGGAVLELELTWRAEDGAALELHGVLLEEEDPPPRPPIVVISVDTLAARHLSIHGYERRTAPELEALAAEGIVFERARANAPFTVPSYLSLFTGLWPTANRVEFIQIRGRAPHPWERELIAPNRWTLAEMLRAAGYRTAAWVDNPWLGRGFGFPQGFDSYDRSAAEVEIWRPHGGIELIAERFSGWLDELPSGEPFFALLQPFDPHGPYHSQPPFRGAFHGDEFHREELVPVGDEQLHAFGVIPEYIAWGAFPQGDWPRRVDAGAFLADYDEGVLETDAFVGEILDDLKARGLYERCVIVVTADHGEAVGQHDYYFDHGTLYDEVLWVPLVVRLPGGAHGGRRVETDAQLVDLYPTLAELVGVAPRTYLHGRSLVPALEGHELPPTPLLAEGGIMKQASLEHEGWKLIQYSPRGGSLQTMLTHPMVRSEDVLRLFPDLADGWHSTAELLEITGRTPRLRRTFLEFMEGPFHELYYLPDDPLELRDLSRERPEKLAELLELLESLRARAEEDRGNARVSAPPVELDEETLQQLEDLGYLDRGEDH